VIILPISIYCVFQSMKSFFDSSFGKPFLPHGQSYFWQADIVWSQAFSNGTIGLTCFTIAFLLWFIIRNKPLPPSSQIIPLLAVFMIGCGMTHFLDIVTIWVPWYGLDSTLRIITALAFAGATFTFVKIIPATKNWQSVKEELVSANEKLQAINQELTTRNYFIEQVMDTTPDLIYIFNLHTSQSVYVSKDAFQTLGYSPQDFLKMTKEEMRDLIHPEDLQRRNDYYRNFKTARDKEIREVEYRFRLADGSFNWFRLRCTVFRRNAEGIPEQVIGISQNINRLKEMEASLQEALQLVQHTNEELLAANEEINSSLEELQTLNESLIQHNHFIERITTTIPHLIYLFNLKGFHVEYTNRELPALLGYTPEQTQQLGSPASVMKALIHPDDYEKRRQHYLNFTNASNDEVRESEFRLLHSNGEYRFFLFTNAVFSRNTEGIPNQLIGLAQDITPLKQTEQELRKTNEALLVTQQELQELSIELEQRVQLRTAELAESNERFELAAQATNDAIWEIYEGSPVIQWSNSFKQLFGYLSKEEELNPTLEAWLARIHPDDRNTIIEQQKQNLARREKTWRMEYRFLCSDGRYAHVLTRDLVLYNPNKSAHRLVGSVMDISPLKEAELSLQKRNEELQKINNDLDNFIYASSHDLKHPITNLEGLLTMVQMNLVSTPASGIPEWFQMMDDSVKRLKKTIQDISEISKVQKGLEEAYEEIDFTQILFEIKEDMSHLIRESAATIRTDFRIGQMYYARKNLRSILYNLLSNALKYRSPSRPALVEIETFMQENQLVLTVRDNGLGLNEKQQSKLFMMFKRMHTHVEGTGIGLYMIKRIIENNGGKIKVESEPEAGTCFTIYFKVQNPL
jgi:PAS domain S-box-containing protein